jgi:hypothetical protein
LDDVPKGDFAKDAQEALVQVQEPLEEEFEALVEEQEVRREVLFVVGVVVQELAVLEQLVEHLVVNIDF